MGQFKPMVKMETTEPSVILKLKKGGHVASKHEKKEEHGHMGMHHTEHHKKHHAENEERSEHGESPKKPSMSERRKAMSGALLNSKHGGKVHHKAMGGMMGAPAAPMGAPAAPMAAPMDPRKAAMLKAMMARKAGMGAPAAPMAAPMGAMKKGGKVKMHEEHEIRKLEKELKHHESQKDSMHGGSAHMKRGGKVHKISGHPEGSHEHHKHMAKHHAKMHKEGGSAHHHKMHEHHKAMCSGGMMHKAAGGAAMDKFETKTTIEGNAKKFAKTKVDDGQHHDKHHGTKGIKDGQPAGFKKGGTIEGNEGKFSKTKVVDGDRKDTASGTKGLKDGQPAGFKKGGTIKWENRPADDGDKFDPAHGTTGVRESNAGGYKKGGAAKKHFATGGSVEDTGRAVAMPRKPVSKPVSNDRQSGTFKKGGKVVHKADGGVEFSPDQDMGDVSPADVKEAKQRAMQTSAIDKLLGRGPTQKQSIHAGGYKKGGNAKR